MFPSGEMIPADVPDGEHRCKSQILVTVPDLTIDAVKLVAFDSLTTLGL
jgi:hypothetical protein